MTCNHCAQEFDSSVTVCPNCGRALVYGASAARGPADNPIMPPFNPLTNTDAGPAPTLGTTMSVTGSSSIRARLRPRETFEIFSEALRLYRENWKLFWGITLACYVPFTILSVLWSGWSTRVLGPTAQGDWAATTIKTIPTLVFSCAPLFLAYWGLVRAVSDRYLGRNASFSEIVSPDSRVWGLVGATTIQWLVMIAPFAVVMGACLEATKSFSHGGPGDAGIDLGIMVVALVIGFVVMVVAALYWCIATSVAIIEGRGAVKSLVRSAELVKGFVSKAFSMLFLPGLIAWLIKLVIEGSVEFIVIAPLIAKGPAAMSAPGSISLLATCGISAAGIIAAMVATPILLLPVVLFYYDLRVRKEAFDLQMLAEQLGYGYQDPGPGLASA